MRLMILSAQRLGKEAAARGETVPVWGPSPGFRVLRWIKPVMAGDTISFANQVESKRTSDSRPEWGIVQIGNTGTNHNAEWCFPIWGPASCGGEAPAPK